MSIAWLWIMRTKAWRYFIAEVQSSDQVMWIRWKRTQVFERPYEPRDALLFTMVIACECWAGLITNTSTENFWKITWRENNVGLGRGDSQERISAQNTSFGRCWEQSVPTTFLDGGGRGQLKISGYLERKFPLFPCESNEVPKKKNTIEGWWIGFSNSLHPLALIL